MRRHYDDSLSYPFSNSKVLSEYLEKPGRLATDK
jgi:hypothetical protein